MVEKIVDGCKMFSILPLCLAPLELNPVFGKSNPLAPPFNIWFDGDKAYGQVRMDWQYEGPPNSVHGGFVAALFDQFLGVAQKMTKQPGFTGTLNIRYLVPTPIDTDLRLEGWVEKIEGRTGGLVIGDRTIGLEKRFTYSYDLGTVWNKHRQMPFVFAIFSLVFHLLVQTPHGAMLGSRPETTTI